MNVSSVEAWLTRKVARESALSLLGCAGLFLASALVLLFTFWIVYCFLWFIGFQFRHWFSIPQAVRVSVGLLVLVLLFIDNARTDPEYLSVNDYCGDVRRFHRRLRHCHRLEFRVYAASLLSDARAA